MFPKPCLSTLGLLLISLRLIPRSIPTAIPQKPNDNDVVSCYRKQQPGRKMTELLVHQTIRCKDLQDCFWECTYEKSFVCKGFSYRHETDGSEGTCELSSTPYLRMNLDKDFLIDSRYDYYERDYNCLPSIDYADVNAYSATDDQSGRYGQEHHAKKPAWTWFDRTAQATPRNRLPVFMDSRPLFHSQTYPLDRTYITDFSDTSGVKSKEQRLYDDTGDSIPHRHAAPAHWNWQNSESSQYLGPDIGNFYPDRRINYGEEYSSAGSRIPTKFQHVDRSRAYSRDSFLSPPSEQTYGKFDKYGGAFDYTDNYMPPALYKEHGKLAVRRKCSIKIAMGSKLSRGIIRKTCLARDSKECEELCINETSFSCKSFAHRYDVLTTNPTDNCLLSDVSYQDLHFYTDIEPDRDYDSYVLTQDSADCYPDKVATNQYPSEECFLRVRSGFNIPPDVTKKSMFAHDVGECQFSCAMSREFTCKSVAFRYAPSEYPGERVRERVPPANCFLTDWSSADINPVNMPDTDGVELYERNSFNFGCETSSLPFPAISDEYAPNGKKYDSDDNFCYYEHNKPCRLHSHAIVSSVRAPTKSECRRICSSMRNAGTTPCMAFAYTIDGSNVRDNCQLSDISMRDLRPNLDYTYDGDHTLYTWNEFNPHCNPSGNFIKPINTASSTAPEEESALFHHESNYPSYLPQPAFEDGTRIVHPSSPKSESKIENHISDYEYKISKENGAVRHPQGIIPFHPTHGFASYHAPSDVSSFRRYTVNGYPCKNGTVCQRNEIVGFWSCEIENSEYGDWDYCCTPNHRCGYSQGYDYLWCYVGSNEDQWRPCSETYYPYYLSNNRPFNPQSLTYSARHWPIIYLHETSPPNCTIDTRNDQNFNQTYRLSRRRNFH